MERDAHLMLFDDEEFTLADNIKRRKFFQPLLPGDFPERAQNVICLNLTADRHFAQEGATQFHHLNPETYDLLSLLFHAFSFALGKKKRLSTASSASAASTNAGRGRGSRPVAVTEGEEAAASEEVIVEEADRHQFYFQGDDYLSLILETLLQTEERGVRVVGLRLWVQDSSTEGTEMDLLTRGLQECLLDAQAMQREIRVELEKLSRSPGKRAPSAGATTTTTTTALAKGPELKQHYHFSHIVTHPMFLTLAANYFANDAHLLQHHHQGEAEGYFIDRRAFLRHNSDQEEDDGAPVRRGTPSVETLPLIFRKEHAMFYHVEKSQVVADQRCLASYCSENAEELQDALERQERQVHSLERLSALCDGAVHDRHFARFPFPGVTYRLENQYLSNELLSQMPLPHRMGSYLYTSENRAAVARRIRSAMTTVRPGASLYPSSNRDEEDEAEMEAEDEESSADSAERQVVPLGIHDVEVEVTPELFHNHPQFTSEETLRAMSGEAYVLGENTKAGFMNQARNTVHLGVLATMKTVSETRRVYHTDAKALKEAQKEESPAGLVNNANKQYVLDRRIYAVIGRGEGAKLKDRQKMLSSCNMAHYRTIIGRWRPIAATVANVLLHCRNIRYAVVYLERDIYWVLDSLNELGFANLDRRFYDPVTGRVRLGQLDTYLEEKRLFIEAITAEFFHEFFTNQRVSLANTGIREDLKKGSTVQGRKKAHRLGIKMSLMKYDKQVLPFHGYMLWVNAYFTEGCGISRLFKPMNILFHGRLHHCRTFTPESRDPKNNVTLLGKGMVGKSHLLSSTRQSCPTDVCIAVSHWTNQAFNVDQNISDLCMIQDEMSNKLLGPNAANKNNSGHSDGGQDDARNNYKERATSHESVTMEFNKDEETGDRRMRISKAQNQYVTLGASNVEKTEIDPNVLSRQICISVARSADERIGYRPQDKNRLELGIDGDIATQQLEEVREVHRLYFMMECMMKSGIFQNRRYGVAISAAQIYMGKFLDLLSAKYGINTNNIRKRTFVLEMARSLCISEKCWWVSKSPQERGLYHDPYTQEYIGLNPRVLLDGVGKHLVVSKHHVVMAITMLSCLWGHEHEDHVLETIAIGKCELKSLKTASFLHREAVERDGENQQQQQQVDRGRRASYYAQDGQEMVVDYNYISMVQKSHADIHQTIEISMGDKCISGSEIAHILREYSKQFLQCDGYVMAGGEVVAGVVQPRRLVRSGDPQQSILRKIVDYRKVATRPGQQQQYAIDISVAFLKQKLYHLLPDDLIEDLATREYSGPREEEPPPPPVLPAPVPIVERPLREDSEESTVHDDDEGEDEMAVEPALSSEDAVVPPQEDSFHKQLQEILSVQKNSSNDIYITKAIREVLEHDILEWTGMQTPEEEAEDMADYADLMTGKLPWMSFVTADCPPPVKTEVLFPDLMKEYRRIPGYNKEILLVDKLSVLELERKKDCKPFVTYNFTTAAPSARSSLSVYNNTADADEAEEEDNYYAEQGESLEAKERRHARLLASAEESREELLVIAKNRFKMYSDSPVFFSQVDLDYDECLAHLLQMAYPVEQVVGKYDRLCNYEPHMYMSMMDYRDRHEKRTGNRIPLVPVYADVMEKLSTTRKIIEATVNRTPAEERRTFTELCQANYEAVDLATRRSHGPPRERRSQEVRHTRHEIRKDVEDGLNKRYRILAATVDPRAGKKARTA